jgi:sugar lactone lactonase YvrE
MKRFGWISIGAVAGVLVAPAARAQDAVDIHTVAGRGIGDGRAATAASLDTPTGVTFAADGAVLIADYQHHRVRRIDPQSGVITTLAGTLQGTAGDGGTPDVAELKGPVRVRLTKAGDVLIVEREGTRIRRIRKDNGTVDTVPVGANVPGFALVAPNDVAEDSQGNLYIADMNAHRVWQLSALGVTTPFAGTGTPAFGGDNGPAAAAALQFPACVAVGPGDVVYICDKANHRIRKVQGGIITTVAGTGVPGFTGDGAATAVALKRRDIAPPAASSTSRIRRTTGSRQIDLANNALETLAGTGPSGFGSDNVPRCVSARVADGFSRSQDDQDVFAGRVAPRARRRPLTTLAGDGIDRFGGDMAGRGRLRSGWSGVAADAAGNLFVSDSGARAPQGGRGEAPSAPSPATHDDVRHQTVCTTVSASTGRPTWWSTRGASHLLGYHHHRVRLVGTDGKIHTVIGNGVAGFSGDGGPAANAQIASPTGLAFDAAGNLYIADFDNHRIRMIDLNGNVQTIAGDGNGGFNGDGLAATATSLFNPTDVAFDSAGNMIIADMRNQRVRRLDKASGTITTVAGTGTALSSDDFIPAVTANLLFPTDVAVDAQGNVLIADSGSNRIRRVDANGVIDSIVGSRTPGDSGDDGPALLARLLTPLRMVMAPDGRLLIVDHDNHRIRAVGEGGPGGGGGDTDCTQGTCAAGGGNRKTDCFVEFNAGVGAHGNKFICKDGDPACDHDAVARQCTVSLKVCFGVADPRLSGKCAAWESSRCS